VEGACAAVLQQPSCFGAKNELRRGGGGWLCGAGVYTKL